MLILVKHSMPEIDRASPAREWRLSSDGKARCAWLARELLEFRPTVLRSSGEPKAAQTAEIVGSILGIAAACVDGLHENDRTDFPYIHEKNEFEQRFRDYFNNPDARLIGRESANEALARFRDAVSRIVEEHPGETVCVVAHGTVISLFVARYNNVSPFAIWKSLDPLPAYITVALPNYKIAGCANAFRG